MCYERHVHRYMTCNRCKTISEYTQKSRTELVCKNCNPVLFEIIKYGAPPKIIRPSKELVHG